MLVKGGKAVISSMESEVFCIKKWRNKVPYFGTLSDNEIFFIFLITSNGKFLHRSFIIRNEVLISNVND